LVRLNNMLRNLIQVSPVGECSLVIKMEGV
jgi:hypothetical protein